jgi:antitoxin (DNA-binding transcriptional repressor) of toxin-antitoxin stability system
MRAVGIRELRDHLSEYIRVVAAGEVVLVTDRDVVVAEISPPGQPRPKADLLWADLVHTGLVRPPLIRDGSAPAFVGPVAEAPDASVERTFQAPAPGTVGELETELSKDRAR